MPDDQDDQETADDRSTAEATESDQQTSQERVTDESSGQTTDAQSQTEETTDDQSQGDQVTDVQSAGDAGVAETDDDCAGWFSDAESMSKRAAKFYVRNELTGDRGVVEKIEVFDRGDPVSYSCTVHFSDKSTTIQVVVFRDKIIVRQDLPGISDRLTCWYDYKCPPPNRDLVLTKRECKMMAPIDLRPLR